MVFVGSIVNIRNECLFFMGNELDHGTKKKSPENQFAVHSIGLSRAQILSP